jgi:hypothetical protein
MSIVQVFHPLWCWVGLCLYESDVVFHPLGCKVTVWGSMMWFEQRLEWWRWLIPSWHVVWESANDRILGVDPPGQYVPSHVRYGTTCLLIRNAICCVSCSVEWGLPSFFVSYFVTYFVICLNHMVQEGTFAGESLALQVGPFAGESIAKHDVLL